MLLVPLLLAQRVRVMYPIYEYVVHSLLPRPRQWTKVLNAAGEVRSHKLDSQAAMPCHVVKMDVADLRQPRIDTPARLYLQRREFVAPLTTFRWPAYLETQRQPK